MALRLIRGGNYGKAYDEDTGEEVLVRFNAAGDGDYTVVGRVASNVAITDQSRNQAAVSEDGCLKAADFSGGPPVSGTDAAGASTFAILCTVDRPCRHIGASVTGANGATLSLGDSYQNHLSFKPAGTTGGSIVWDGLNIPAGTTIYGKNLVAGSNYANLTVNVW